MKKQHTELIFGEDFQGKQKRRSEMKKTQDRKSLTGKWSGGEQGREVNKGPIMCP